LAELNGIASPARQVEWAFTFVCLYQRIADLLFFVGNKGDLHDEDNHVSLGTRGEMRRG
ncbi:unnamed protein product, partial [Amoebophrya sp. A25]